MVLCSFSASKFRMGSMSFILYPYRIRLCTAKMRREKVRCSEDRTQRSRPIVEDGINLKEIRYTLKSWPQFFDIEYTGTRMIQVRREGRRPPIPRLLVEAQ